MKYFSTADSPGQHQKLKTMPMIFALKENLFPYNPRNDTSILQGNMEFNNKQIVEEPRSGELTEKRGVPMNAYANDLQNAGRG